MSVGRRQVFIGKVLKRLFAATPSTSHVPVPSGEEMVLKTPASKPQQKDSENAQASSECASSPGRENEILLPRLYTVSLPPEGYVPGNPRTASPTNAENLESSDDAADKSKCTDSPMSSATVQEILQHLESHSMASSDVTLLHQMKSLVLLQDTERLKGILEQFQEHSMMLPDHAKIISSLFHYWITDILPVKNRK
ncbi:zinc finger protein 609 [Platysternon megacephalum]|uniref:Zinc finger protein 609 n=1 Tax=Platysternon megacephalum TaxID=55544 RepID=A0A4D9E0U3_9SAUR|nr:zinc finger protein 609 [Platysternon megacephalum]